MPILKHMILLGNTLSVLTLIRYLLLAFFVFGMAFGNTSSFGVLAFLALFFYLFILSLLSCVPCILGLSRNDEKFFHACFIAYIPVVIALLYYAYEACK